MNYSRAHPSSRYLELQTLYRQMHREGEQFLGQAPENTFPGFSLNAQLFRIKELIERSGAQTILDYGCGKGQQYQPRVIQDDHGNKWPSVLEYWDIDEIACYDPCYEPYSKLPADRFDGVISTDVLEHCPEQDVPWIIDEMFSYATRFVFANVACFPARKRLPNGENAHCTIKPVEWWQDLVSGIAARYPGVTWHFWLQFKVATGDDERIIEQKIAG